MLRMPKHWSISNHVFVKFVYCVLVIAPYACKWRKKCALSIACSFAYGSIYISHLANRRASERASEQELNVDKKKHKQRMKTNKDGLQRKESESALDCRSWCYGLSDTINTRAELCSMRTEGGDYQNFQHFQYLSKSNIYWNDRKTKLHYTNIRTHNPLAECNATRFLIGLTFKLPLEKMASSTLFAENFSNVQN